MASDVTKFWKILYRPKAIAGQLSATRLEPICLAILLAMVGSTFLQQGLLSVKLGGNRLDPTLIVQLILGMLTSLALVFLVIKATIFFLKKQIQTMKLVNIILLTQLPKVVALYIAILLYYFSPALLEQEAFNKGMNLVMLLVTGYSYFLLTVAVLNCLQEKTDKGQ